MSQELDQYINLLGNLNDPVYYVIIFAVILFIFIYIIFKNVIFPLQKKHYIETHELELKNVRLMALFAELDPDPVIRTNIIGKIIYTNDSAKGLINEGNLKGKFINELIPQIDIPVIDYINSNGSKSFLYRTNSKEYLIVFRGISSLKIAQLYFHDITEKVENEKKLKDLSENLQNKIEQERQRIARELHDGIGQDLLLLKMDLSNEYKGMIQNTADPEKLKNSIDSLQKTITELNIILFNLTPAALKEMGLGPSIAAMVNKISAAGFIKGSLNIVGLNKRLDDKLEITIYRIIQEALNNIIKYSKAKEFSIQFIIKNNRIKILIADNGTGIPADGKGHIGFGLINIRERVEYFNGIFRIDSSEENGTLLVIDIPLEPEK